MKEVEERIEKYYLDSKKMTKEDKEKHPFIFEFKSLEGLSNKNILVKIIDPSTKNVLERLFYRELGAMSGIVLRKTELNLLEYIASTGLGPKILYFDKENERYRIDEFLTDTTPIEKENEFKDSFMQQIFSVCNMVNSFTPIYKYKVNKTEDISKSFVETQMITDKNCKNSEKVECNTMFKICMELMYNKATTEFMKFKEKFLKVYNPSNNPQLCADLEKLEQFNKNYHKNFLDTWPTEGYLVFCHNDVHRLNLLHKKDSEKLFLIDVEYAALNQIGNDFANYLNESCFVYEPTYSFKMDINFDEMYKYYQKYITKFIEDNQSYFEGYDNKDKLFETIKSKKYYINLHNKINLFWFNYCLIYLDFEKYQNGEDFYFLHGLHRIAYYEHGKNEMNKA